LTKALEHVEPSEGAAHHRRVPVTLITVYDIVIGKIFAAFPRSHQGIAVALVIFLLAPFRLSYHLLAYLFS
jgi:hypothetical protein